MKKTKAKSPKQKSFVYMETHNKILVAIANLIKGTDKQTKEHISKDFNYHETLYRDIEIRVFPTVEQISKEASVRKDVISRHLKELNFENFKGTAQSLTPLVLSSLAQKAIRTGNKAEVELFLQVVEGWKPESKQENVHSGSVDFKISREVISAKI